jgi:hypothetical protein
MTIVIWSLIVACCLAVVGKGFYDRSIDAGNQFVVVLALGFCLMPLGIAIHEAAHAVAALLVGYRVGIFSIGRGPQLFQARLGGTLVEIRRLAIVGYVLPLRDDNRWYRLRRFIFIAAGPLSNLLLCVVMAYCVGSIDDLFASRRPTIWPLVAASFTYTNFLLFLSALVPKSVKLPTGLHPSDGMQLFSLLFRKLPSEALRSSIAARNICRVLLQLREYDKAIEVANAALLQLPSDVGLLFLLAAAQLDSGRYSLARHTLLSALGLHSKPDATRASMLNCLAWAGLMLHSDGLMNEVENAVEEANLLTPWSPYVQSTRAQLLIERRQFSQAIQMLEQIKNRFDDRASRSSALCLEAITRHHLGERQRAYSLLKKARRIDAAAAMVQRAAQMMEPTSGDSIMARDDGGILAEARQELCDEIRVR